MFFFLGGEICRKIQKHDKIQNSKNIRKLEKEFVYNTGNDSTSARQTQYAKEM